MRTLGFSCGYSGTFVLNTPSPNGLVSTYVILPTGGTEGGIVFRNSAGIAQYWPYAFIGLNPIAATEILTSAVIDEVTYTTTAGVGGAGLGLTWGASGSES